MGGRCSRKFRAELDAPGVEVQDGKRAQKFVFKGLVTK